MFYKKYFKGLVTITLLFIQSGFSFANIVEKNCGVYIFQVKIINGADLNDRFYKLYFKETGGKSKLFYQTKPGLGLFTMCVQNNKKMDLMLFREFCYGSACAEDIYGLFDPSNKKILLQPADWPKGNQNEVEKIVGKKLFIQNEEVDHTFFCCFKKQNEI